MDRVELIRERINQALEPETLKITDDSHLHVGHPGAAAGGGHYSVRIVSNRFDNHSMIERHRLVYQAVDDLIPSQIHALSIDAVTPEECQSQQKD